jgi:alpha,alpha-trehalase
MKTSSLFFVEDLEEVFVDVQSGKVFEDQKFFSDCTPKIDVKEIVEKYREEKGSTGFSFLGFCKKYFEFPESSATGFVSDPSKKVEEHIALLWDVLTKQAGEDKQGSLIVLPHPFVVPGGRFREIYYWDSYFTMLGLQVSKRVDLIENMVKNFAYLINEFGFIPNGNRSYFLSRSQPPFFSLMVELLREEKGKQVLIDYLPALEKEYQFWMSGKEILNNDRVAEKHVVLMKDGELLNRYWDKKNEPREESYLDDLLTAKESKANDKELYRHIRAAAESGWDFSSRWFRDEKDMGSIYTTEIIPVDLNCLLYQLEKTIEKAFAIAGKEEESKKYQVLSSKRNEAIQKYLWDGHRGYYGDYDFVKGQATGKATLAMLFPLFLNLATPARAVLVSKKIEDKFLKPGGLVTTLCENGQQWDAPNGWAPLQWVGFKGALNYGFKDLAKNIKEHWTKSIEASYKATGKLTEKYNVMETAIAASGGEYPNQDGFGWTNGVYLKMKQL